jgi:hypothetical protein
VSIASLTKKKKVLIFLNSKLKTKIFEILTSVTGIRRHVISMKFVAILKKNALLPFVPTLSRVLVTIDGVRIGNWIYLSLTRW